MLSAPCLVIMMLALGILIGQIAAIGGGRAPSDVRRMPTTIVYYLISEASLLMALYLKCRILIPVLFEF